MSRLDRAKAAARASRQATEATKSYGGYGGYGSSFMGDYSGGYNLQQNPIIKVLGQQTVSADPRVKLATYRALTGALTIIQRAIQVHSEFIGTPNVIVGEKGNPRAVAILERFWAETPIFGKYINPMSADHGLGSFVSQMIASTFGDGSQFFRLMQPPTTARVNKSPIEGLRLFDSGDFEYIPDPADLERALLSYMSPNGQIYITPEMGYGEFHFSIDRRFPWGTPIAYGPEFFCRQFIEFIIAHIDGTKRKANPIGITLIGFKAPPQQAMTNAKEYAANAQIMMESTQKLKDTHKDALRVSKTTGAPQDEILILPGDVSLSSQFYGAGIEMPPNFEEMCAQLVKDVALGLDTPMMFLGIDQGGGGLGSSLFAYQKTSLVEATKKEREKLEKNCLRVICDQVLVQNSIQVTPDTYGLEWETVDLDDEKLEAETRKLDAEAFAQELLNVAAIATTLSGRDPEAAHQAYIEDIDQRSWE